MKIASPEYQRQLTGANNAMRIGRQPVEERVGEHREESDDEQRPGAKRQRVRPRRS